MPVITASIMDNVQLDIDTLNAIAPTFWEVMAEENLTEEEKSQILRLARIALTQNPFDPARAAKVKPPLVRGDFIQKTLTASFKIVRRSQEIEDLEKDFENEGCIRVFEEEIRRNGEVGDPLVWRDKKGGTLSVAKNEVVIVDEFGLPASLELAPYEATFFGNSPVGIYLEHPYHVPHFRLIPSYWETDNNGEQQAILAKRKDRDRRQGRKGTFTQKDLGQQTSRQINAMYKSLTECLMELIGYYLNEHGFRTLKSKYWGIIADINTHGLKPIDIQKKRKLTPNQYNGFIKVLQNRGWVKAFHPKKKRVVLKYFPILDGNKQLVSAMVDLQLKDPEAIMRLIAEKLDTVLYEPKSDDDGLIERALIQVNRDTVKACSDNTLHYEWDRKLRAFVQDFISMPVTEGADLEELNERFKLLPQEAQLRIFTEAKRQHRCIFDVMNENMTAVFADVLVEEEGLSTDDGVSLKDLIKTMNEINGWGVEVQEAPELSWAKLASLN